MIKADFIAQDWCGWLSARERFTAMPGGETLSRKPYMGESEWKAAKDKWFAEFDPAVPVCRCAEGSYKLNDARLGTAGDMRPGNVSERTENEAVKAS